MKPKFKLGQEVFTYSNSPVHVIDWKQCNLCDGTGEVMVKSENITCPRPGCLNGRTPILGRKVISPGKITDIRETKRTHLSGSGRISKHTQIDYLCWYGEILADPVDEKRLFSSKAEAQAECDKLNQEKK